MKILLPLLFLALSPLAAQEAEHEFPPPAPNEPWLHGKTGLRFPHELAGMTCENGFDYGDVPSGESLRYVNRDLRIRADVYVFPCPHPLDTPAAVKEATRIEAQNVLAGLEEMAKRGLYSHIRQNTATYKEVDLYPESAGKSGWLEFTVNAVIHEKSPAGDSEQDILSYGGIGVFRDHFVKVRCTVPAENNKEVEKQISDFVGAVRFCTFMEPGLRAEMRRHIRAYRVDPFSDAARDAVGAMVFYAEETPTLFFSVSGKVATLGGSLKPSVADADKEFMGAFFIGAVDAGVREPPPKTVDLEQGGAEEMVRLYERLKKNSPKLQSNEMDVFVKATKAGKGGEWLRDNPPAPSKSKEPR
ncbi:MAG TPA: hypothetical protein VD994_00740 [Prosthecobacter sp.]|nr:hypothetical protein [Prosthecobacter sp.]